MVEDFLANAWTALPGIVQSFDPVKGTCTVQVAVKARQRQSDGSYKFVNIAPLHDIVVMFQRAGSFVMTFPIQSGDECLVVFSCRDISGWWQQGGTQLPVEIRTQDISDGFAFVGPFSKPSVPSNISTNSVQLRTLDQSCYIEMAAGGRVNIVAPGGVHVTGAIVASDEITAKNTHTVSAHIHSDPQGGSTGAPTG